jgi:hypothetical protein
MHPDTLIKRLPECELHIHIEGSLEPEQMFALARLERHSPAGRGVAAGVPVSQPAGFSRSLLSARRDSNL